MSKVLIIINDAPYGTEKAYNALRIANQLNKDFPDTSVVIFLMADGVNCAIADQNTPNGYYNIERMLKLSTNKGARLLLCGSCVEARGLKNVSLADKAEISNMAELTRLIIESDKVINC
ncbi:MAG: DsrE family protein [Saprospiraceae bacterium]|nr:DsrE family protein [Saprospiraceae bacterium]